MRHLFLFVLMQSSLNTFYVLKKARSKLHSAKELVPTVKQLIDIVKDETELNETNKTKYLRESLKLSLSASLLERIARSAMAVETAVQAHSKGDRKRVVTLSLSEEEEQYGVVEYVISVLVSKKYYCSVAERATRVGAEQKLVISKILTVRWTNE